MAAENPLSALPQTTFVVLGLVSAKPRSGHELTEYAERSVMGFFSLTRSHIYSELNRLHELELVSVIDCKQAGRPTGRVYHITEAGERALRDWVDLDDSSRFHERHRNMFLVRLFFGDRMSPARLSAMLGQFERETRTKRDLIAALNQRLIGRPGSKYRRAAAMWSLAMQEAKLQWLADVRPLLLASDSEPRSAMYRCESQTDESTSRLREPLRALAPRINDRRELDPQTLRL